MLSTIMNNGDAMILLGGLLLVLEWLLGVRRDGLMDGLGSTRACDETEFRCERFGHHLRSAMLPLP